MIASVPTAIILYYGLTRGTGKTVDVALKKLEEKAKQSPTMQRFLKVMEKSDQLFGDDQAIAQITGFFKEARDLVGSKEAKNFFTNASKALSEFTKTSDTEKQEEDLIHLPEKPE